MHRALQLGVGLALALAILTCTDERVTGPARPGHLLLDVHALQAGSPGQPVIPFDSLRITLRRPTETTYAYDKTVLVRSDTVKGDSVVLRLDVQLQRSSEDFILDVTTFGAGIVWYALTATVHLTADATAAPSPFLARYVGPGHNAKAVRVFPVDTTAIGGTSFPLRSVVTDSSDAPISGVPVGYRLSDATHGSVTSAYLIASFTAAPTVRDSVWVFAETPTHLKDSTRIHILPPAASLQKVSGDAQTAVLGGPLKNPLVVRVLDALSGGFKGDTVRWTVTTANATLTAPLSVSDDTGYALVSLTPSVLGPVTVQATVAGLSGSPQTFTATATAGPPANIQIVSGNAQSDTVNVTLTPFVVKVTDALNNPVSGATVSWNRIAGAGTLSAATTATDAAGLTQITYTLGAVLGPEQVRATLVGTSANVVFAATVTVGTGTVVSTSVTPKLDTLTALTATVTLAAQARNAAGSPVTGTFTWVSRTPAIATVSAAGLVTAVAIGSSYVVATEAGGTKDSALIVVQQRPANIAIVSGSAQSDTVKATLAPFVVKVTDALNNPVSGASVSWNRIAGSGAVSATTTVTDAAGLTQITYTLGTVLGTEQVRATLVGTSANVQFTATVTAGVGTVVSTSVTPKLDTLTALTATVTLVAQGRNAAGNPVAGTFTWVSRTPAIATVSAAGLVKAVANGSSYVVATEASGTKDSALIVVQQRIATINVTPGTRNIYLTRSFAFTATAVDGLGSPVAGVTTFTWTSTAPAVATVDAAGHVNAVGLGSAQIRAASGAITGVANVSVITPITRIAVVVDTVGAFKTDTFTITSLGLTRRYRAIAHDTVDAVMSGVSFTWVSTNGSVAVLGSNAGDTSTATSAANGVTLIQATAQGFTSSPGALLTVSQVLASIALSPPASNPTATIAITGTVGLVARGKDANGRFIAGGSFQFASATTAVATVDAISGVVTGISNGTSNITASSGAITSNALTVTVGGAVPAIISFGRDTVSVGRGSSASIPILLSKPAVTPLTVNLTVSAFAHWSASSIVIPANVTSANATLVGDSAGTATVTATDGSGLGYASASAVAKVTANMRFTSSSYAINATDVTKTQVLLSDPSPAGGTYVTFNYSTSGIASISPNPALIPAGQLAADIQIRALAAGTTNITPNAVGVNGAASSFQAYPAVLTPSTTLIRLGAGQYEPNDYVYLPTNTNSPVPVTLTSSDTNLVIVTPSVTIPVNSYYAYLSTSARAIGSATISLAAPGWTASGTIAVVSTTPYVGICCANGGLFTTSPQQTVTVYAEDSTRSAHSRTNSLVVRLSSTDTTVIRVLDTLVTIQPGQSYNSSGRFVVGGLVGSAYIVATASGHQPDSAKYTVNGPPLTFSWGGGTPRIGGGQFDASGYVYTPNNVAVPLVVTITSSDSTVLGLPTSVTIPAGSYYAYITVRGKKPGSVTLTATAPGYKSISGSYVVTTPRITACCSSTFNNFSLGSGITVYSADSVGTAHYRIAPLPVSLVSSDTTVIKIDSLTVTIDSGQPYNTRAHIRPVGVGTARIIYAASGHLVLDSLTITVVTPPIRFSISSALLGRRQHFDPNYNGFYVYTPDNRTAPLAVTITQRHGTEDSLTTRAPTIATGSYYVYLDAFGLATGTDTLTVSAPGYLPSTAFITVTTPQFTNCCMPSTTTSTNPPLGITVYTTDSVGSAHYSMDTIVVAAVSSDTNVIRPVQRSFRILKNTYYAQSTVNVIGPGAASITYSDSAGTGYRPTTTATVTVTGPSLAFTNGSPMLGMRQSGGTNSSYVSTPNNVATPLVVNLLSTDPRVVTVPASVTIPTGTNYAYFDITAHDTVGTIQIKATATGYNGASTNVQVTQPKFVMSTATQLNTTSPAQIITITAADANGTSHYTTENVTVTLASSAPSVASIDSATVTIPSGAYYVNTAKWSPGLVGTAQLSASDARAAYYRYNTGTFNVAVITPSLSFSWGTTYLGIGQYQDNVYVSAPDNQKAALTVTLAHTGAPRTSTFANLTTTPITSVTIPVGTYYQYFRLAGASAGTDTLVASAQSPAHNPATAYTVVTLGRIDPIGGWPATLKAGDSVAVTLYARDFSQIAHNVLNATTWTLAPNPNIEFRSGGATSAVITSVTIPADQQAVTFYIKGLAAGTGSATMTATNYQPYTNTVTITP